MARVIFSKYCVVEPAKLGVSALWSQLPAVPFGMMELTSPAGGKNDAGSFWPTKTRLP